MKKSKFRFNNRALDQLPPHEADSPSRSAEYSDTEVIGLRVLVSKQGRKYFFFRYTYGGEKRAAKVGEYPAIDVQEARRLALEMRAKLGQGINPKTATAVHSTAPTFGDFAREEYLPFAFKTKRSAKDDECRLRVHAFPKFGARKLTEISTKEIQQFHADMKESHCPATANRHLSVIARMYSLALQWGRVERNPCSGISKFKENNIRQKLLTSEEIGRMYAAMEREPNKVAVAAIKFLILTGARLQEALQAKWQHVDFDKAVWFLPHTKSGRGRYVQLSGDAQAVLKALALESQSQTWVFPGREPGKPLNNPRKAFGRILEAAGLEHMRLHDLRHLAASLAANAGVSLTVIGGLLGHQSPVMSLRYSHIANTTLREASEVIALAISKATTAPRESVDA